MKKVVSLIIPLLFITIIAIGQSPVYMAVFKKNLTITADSSKTITQDSVNILKTGGYFSASVWFDSIYTIDSVVTSAYIGVKYLCKRELGGTESNIGAWHFAELYDSTNAVWACSVAFTDSTENYELRFLDIPPGTQEIMFYPYCNAGDSLFFTAYIKFNY